jgi:hypothetical protein
MPGCSIVVHTPVPRAAAEVLRGGLAPTLLTCGLPACLPACRPGRDPFKLLHRLPPPVEQAQQHCISPSAPATAAAQQAASTPAPPTPRAATAAGFTPDSLPVSPRAAAAAAGPRFIGLSVSSSETQLVAASTTGRLLLLDLEGGAPAGLAGPGAEEGAAAGDACSDPSKAELQSAVLPEEVSGVHSPAQCAHSVTRSDASAL